MSSRPRRMLAFARGPAPLLVPAFAVMAVITGWPLVQLVYLSFHKYGRAQIFGKPPEFVGLDNYTNVLTDEKFWLVLERSLVLCAVSVVATMVLGMAVAVLMTQLSGFGRSAVSVALLFAWAMPPISATTIGGWFFHTQRGLVNYLITALTPLDYTNHSWLSDPASFFFVATVIITWQSVPFVAFTVYAALTQVPGEVIEAASIDGAGPWSRFRRIVVPYIRSVLVVLIVLEIIWDIRVFPQIYTLQTIGGNFDDTNTIGVYIYQISSRDLGSSGAISVLLVIIMLVISGYYIRSLLREEAR